VRASGLRGRGGGGFPTGAKWAGVATAPGTHRFAVCNAAEGEPGTFKDRRLMRANPYQLIEGLAIAAFAIGAREAFIGLKASFTTEIDALERALAQMQEAGLAGEVPIRVVPGPDEYLFGEEKALLEVIEGKDPLPRLLPPYQHGLFSTAPQMGWVPTGVRVGHHGAHESNPTLVNNAETLSNVPHILARGPEWFRTMGTHASPGTIVVTVVGDVARPDVGEVEMGTPLADVIDSVGGGPLPGRQLKAVFSGVANAVVDASRFSLPLTYEDFAARGTGLGAAGFIVYDDTACMVEVARLFSRFLYVESCGQCPPCKLGSEDITARLERIEAGEGDDDDIEVIGSWLGKVTDGARCYLATEERDVVSSILRAFSEEFAEHLEQGRCPRPRTLPLPKIVDLGDGRVAYDEAQARKQPDWTYAGSPT
jgi:NADH-quinone oxidoreductase subunit F